MYEHVTTEEVAGAIDELVHGLGVKEDLLLALPSALSREALPQWVQTIANSLGLPVQVKVSFVSRKSGRPGFGTTAVSRTGPWGRGTHSISAQVSIPNSIPMFGTSGLRGFPIEVRVSENCGDSPATFVAVMAHELSHVLLGSLRHPRKESELHTDLVPLLLGFRSVVSVGRTHVEHRKEGDVTTTFGYLTDAQFGFAVGYVEQLLVDARRKQADVEELVRRMTTGLLRASRQMARFKAYRVYVNRHPPQRTKQGDAERLVRFNDVDYTRDWERSVGGGPTELSASGGPFSSVSHYTIQVLRGLERQRDQLSAMASGMDDTLSCLDGDIATLRRYLPLDVKLRENRWIGWLFGGRIHLDDLVTGEGHGSRSH